MKRAIQKKSKTSSSSNDKKNTRSFTTKHKGYKEEVYNKEEQKNYDKSELANKQRKNTSGPEY
jgi:hypothetical protein